MNLKITLSERSYILRVRTRFHLCKTLENASETTVTESRSVVAWRGKC